MIVQLFYLFRLYSPVAIFLIENFLLYLKTQYVIFAARGHIFKTITKA